jgi:TRAP-type C4-dicarboxylate transport system permease small subunit
MGGLDPMTSEDRKVGSRITAAISILGGAAIFAILLHTLANVVMRFFFNSPLPNAIEIVSYIYMLVLGYSGFLLAKFAKQTMDAPIIFDSLTWGNRRLLVIFASALAAIFCGATAYYTLTGEAIPGMLIGKTAGASTLVIWPTLFLVPVVFAVLAVSYVADTVNAVQGRFDDGSDLEAAFNEVAAEAGDDVAAATPTGQKHAAIKKPETAK